MWLAEIWVRIYMGKGAMTKAILRNVGDSGNTLEPWNNFSSFAQAL